MNFAERVDSGTNPLSLAALDSCSPFCRLAATSSPGRGKSFHSGGALGKEGRSRPHSLTAGKSQPLSGKLYAPAKASPFRERWHGKAVMERVVSGTHPLTRLRRQLSRRESPWQRGQVSSSFVNGIRSQPISGKLSALAKASPFRERWHGEAVTERVSPRLAAALGERFPNRSRGKIGKSVCAKENIPSDAFCPAECPTAET